MNQALRSFLMYAAVALVGLPVCALLAQYLTLLLAGFKPRFRAAFLSVSVAYGVSLSAGLIIRAAGGMKTKSTAESVGLLAGLAILSACHANFIRSDSGLKLSPGKAIAVAVAQVIGGLLLLAAIVKSIVVIKGITG